VRVQKSSNAYETRIFIYVFSHDWGSIAIVLGSIPISITSQPSGSPCWYSIKAGN